MGLLDVLNGMQNGPRGQQSPGAGRQGMSPITMAILGLLAYKAVKSFGGQSQSNPSAPGNSTGIPSFPGTDSGLGGMLGNVLGGSSQSSGLGGMLGGLLGGGAAGGVLSGGLNDLLNQFQQNGMGSVAKSWVGTGPNMAISPQDLEKAIGPEKINELAEHSGMSRDELLEGLSQNLPDVVDQLTPNGKIPAPNEITI